MLRKCGLYLLSFAVLSTSSSVFFSGVSNAASIYDDYLNTTTTLNVGNTDWAGYGGCTNQDITQNWANKLTDTYNSSNTTLDETTYNYLRTSYLTALNGSGRWGVSLNANRNEAYVYWTENSSLTLNWDSGSAQILAYSPTNRIHAAKLSCLKYQDTSKDNKVGVTAYTNNDSGTPNTNGYWTVSGKSNGYKNLFVYTDYYNYPPDYEGQHFSSGTSNAVLPDIDYEVIGKTIKFKYCHPPHIINTQSILERA